MEVLVLGSTTPLSGILLILFYRATELYTDKKRMTAEKKMMQIDNGWEVSAGRYIDIYSSLGN
jgi:glycogen synthase